jgi:hypothetical protein
MMHIRAGYDIAFDCRGPTPMLLVLSIHPSRVPDLVTPHQITFDREVIPYDYVDGFGNVCTRIIAPAGVTTIRTEFVIADSGATDGGCHSDERRIGSHLTHITRGIHYGEHLVPVGLGLKRREGDTHAGPDARHDQGFSTGFFDSLDEIRVVPRADLAFAADILRIRGGRDQLFHDRTVRAVGLRRGVDDWHLLPARRSSRAPPYWREERGVERLGRSGRGRSDDRAAEEQSRSDQA